MVEFFRGDYFLSTYFLSFGQKIICSPLKPGLIVFDCIHYSWAFTKTLDECFSEMACRPWLFAVSEMQYAFSHVGWFLPYKWTSILL